MINQINNNIKSNILFSCIPIILQISLLFSQVEGEPFKKYKETKVYSLQKVEIPPIIDGYLDDPCWQNKNKIDDFLQDEPFNRSNPTEKSEVIIIYDNAALYIAAFLYDDNSDEIPIRMVKRDDWGKYFMSDWFSVEIDSYHNHQSAFEFLVNSSGTQFDDFIFDDNDRDANWDAVWESEVNIDDEGWYVEMRIPFSELRFSESKDQIWGINISRYLSQNNELISWVVLPREINGVVSQFGHIDNISKIKSKRNTTIRPYYIVGTVNYNDYELIDTNKMNFGHSTLDSVSVIQKIGLDIKKYISSNSILDITINPDFGQIESDPEHINLSYYETYYEEKRPFFMESATLFDTPIEMFYSRKIGMNQKYIAGKWNDKKDALIKGAIKLSGKISNGLSYGIISALTTDEEHGDWLHKMVNGDNTTFLITRLTKDFFSGNSYIGFMSTHYNGNSNISNVISLDALSHLFDNKLYIDGQIVSSNVNKLSGLGISFEGKYTNDFNLTSAVDCEFYNKKLDISHIGFLTRNNLKKFKLKLELNSSEIILPTIVRSIGTDFTANYKVNLDDIILDKYIGMNILFDFLNNYYFSSSYYYQYKRSDDRILFDYKDQILQSDSPITTLPAQISIGLGVGTDPNQIFYINSLLYYIKNSFNDIMLTSSLQLNFQNNNSAFSISWQRTSAKQSYYWLDIFDEIIENDMATNDTTSHYIFSNVSKIRDRINLRYTLNITRNATIQFYSEYYTNSDSYNNFSELTNISEYPLTDTEFIQDLIGNIYFTEADLQNGFVPENDNLINPNEDIYYYPKSNRLNLNFILNWEYRPGSNLYFVLTRSRESVGKDLRQFSDFIYYTPSDNELAELFRDYSVFVRMDYQINI